MADLSERVVELLNDIMLADTEKEKIDMVHELGEIVLNREPSLLAEFLPHILALHTDKLAAVRRAIIAVAEQAARKHGDFLVRSLEVFVYRASDEAPSVVKRVLSAFAVLLRPSVARLASARARGGDADASARQLLALVDALGTHALAALSAHAHEGVRVQACHVLEHLALALTPRADGLPPSAVGAELDRLPQDAAADGGARERLERLGAQAVGALAAELPRTVGGIAPTADSRALALALVGSLGAVAREGAARADAACVPLCECAARVAAGAAGSDTELRAALVDALQSVARATAPAAAASAPARHAAALAAIASLDAAAGVSAAAGGGDAEDSDGSGVARAAKRSRVELTARPLSDATIAALAALSPSALAQLALAGMKQLPAEYTVGANEADGAVAARGGEGAEAEATPARAAAAASADECRMLQLKAFRRMLSADYLRWLGEAACLPLHSRLVAALALLAPVGSAEHAELSRYICAKPAERRALALTWLSAEYAPASALSARPAPAVALLELGREGSPFGAAAVGALASGDSPPADGADDADVPMADAALADAHEAVGARARADADARADAEARALQSTHGAAADEPPARYAEVCATLLDALRRSDRAWLSLVSELPGDDVSEELFDSLRSEMEVPDRQLPALNALREIVVSRPTARGRALRMALELATASGGTDACRSAAIRLVASRLHPLADLAGEIETYALGLANELVVVRAADRPAAADGGAEAYGGRHDATEATGAGSEVPVGDGGADVVAAAALAAAPAPAAVAAGQPASGAEATMAAVEADAKRRLLLLLALCTKQPALLRDVLRVFAGALEQSRAVLQRQIGGVIPHIAQPFRLDILIALARDHPAGSELLLLKMLHIAADLEDVPPRALALEMTRLVDSGALDSRFLIPTLPALRKAEVSARLALLCALPSNVARAAILRLVGVGAPRRAPPPKPLPGEPALPPPPPPPPPFSPVDLLVELHRVRTDDDAPEPPPPADAAAAAAAAAAAEATMAKAADAAELAPPSSAPCVRLAALIEATTSCLKERALFPPEVVSSALGQLVGEARIPRLALRTLLQGLIYHPKLADFALDALDKVVSRAPWDGAHGAELWEGFARCVRKLLPKSLVLLLRAPAPRLAPLLDEHPELRVQLLKYITEHKPVALAPDIAALLEGAAT